MRISVDGFFDGYQATLTADLEDEVTQVEVDDIVKNMKKLLVDQGAHTTMVVKPEGLDKI